MLALWIAALVGMLGLRSAFPADTVDDFTLPGTSSQIAYDTLDERFPQTRGDQARLVFVARHGRITDPDVRKDMLERVAAWNDLLRAEGRGSFESVKFTGGALVGHDTVDRIETKTKDGQERVYFVQLETGLLRRLDIYSQSWARWISLVGEDWREANGLLRPYKVTIWDRDKEKLLQTIVYTGIRKE